MRRLPLLVGALVFVDAMFYAAVTPLLPVLSDRLDLSKQAAGVLAGAYAVGTLAGSLPAGWAAARVGFKRTVLIGIALISFSGVIFAFGSSVLVLDGARFLQGVGGAFTFAGGMAWLAAGTPRERRGQAFGAALGAAIFGVQLGPLIGAFATEIGQAPAFSSTVLFGALLGVWAAVTPAPASREALATPARALRNVTVRMGMLLGLLPGVAFGIVGLLAPLRLAALGASGLAIGLIFIFAAGVEALIAAWTGRASDRRGAGVVALWGLLLGAVALAVLPLPGNPWTLGIVVAVGGGVLGCLWVPAMALVTAGADRLGLDQGFAFGLFNLAWAAGMACGAIAGGALAHGTSDLVVYLAVAAAYVATAIFGRRTLLVSEPTASGATVSA